jgi:hypothetical protein
VKPRIDSFERGLLIAAAIAAVVLVVGFGV